MLYEKMLTAVEETSTFGLEWDPHPVQLQHEDYKGLAKTRDAPVQTLDPGLIYLQITFYNRGRDLLN